VVTKETIIDQEENLRLSSFSKESRLGELECINFMFWI